jgi:hypothetical protein
MAGRGLSRALWSTSAGSASCRTVAAGTPARFKLTEGALRVDFKADFANFADAQAAVGPTFSAWETKAALEREPGEFQFIGAMEETTLGHGAYANVLLAGATLEATASCDGAILRSTYPDAPENFRDTAEVRSCPEVESSSAESRA